MTTAIPENENPRSALFSGVASTYKPNNEEKKKERKRAKTIVSSVSVGANAFRAKTVKLPRQPIAGRSAVGPTSAGRDWPIRLSSDGPTCSMPMKAPPLCLCAGSLPQPKLSLGP